MPSISIGRLRGGYCVYWTEDSTGRRKRYQLTARTREEAEAEARDRYLKETQQNHGASVAHIWSEYIEYLGTKPTAKTMRYTGRAVLAHFGHFRPDQITIRDCRAYMAKRTRDGRLPGTIHTELGHLRSSLRWGQKAGFIDRVPHIERPSKPDSDVRPLTEKQVQALIDGCDAPHVRTAVILLFASGARVSAILDLTWDRVDWNRGAIDLRLPDGVTRKGRAVIPMNAMARTALQTAYAARLSDHVIEWAGKPVKSIRTGYAAALRRAELSSVNIHQIRHTVAVRMLSAGVPLEKVSQYLGHSNIAITYKIYARYLPDHMADAAEVVNLDLGRISGA